MFTLRPRLLRCSKHLSRSFNTIAEATHFFQKIHPERSLSKPSQVSTSDPLHYSQTILQVMPYLTSITEIDLQVLLDNLSEKELERVTSFSAMQSDMDDMVMTRNVVSNFPGMSRSIHLSYCVLKDTIYFLKKKRFLDDEYAPKPRYSKMVKDNPVKLDVNRPKAINSSLGYMKTLAYPDMTNLDKLVMVNYWLIRDQWELAVSYLEETYLTEEESLILARTIVHHQQWLVLPTLLRSMECDYVTLAAQHAFFTPSRQVIQALLKVDGSSETIENIGLFLEKVHKLGLGTGAVLELVNLLEMPAAIKMQLSLQYFHSGSEKLSLIIGSVLEQDDFFDLAPILSHTRHTKKHQLCVAFIDQLLKQDLHPVATSLLKQLIRISYISNNLTSTQWVLHLISKLTLRPNDIAALIKAVPIELHPGLLQHACETQLTTLITEIVRYSHQLDQTSVLLSEFAENVSLVSKDDYIEDCLLYYLPEVSGSAILSLSRALSDLSVITPKLEKFWMIVGYDKKGESTFAAEILANSSKMFSTAEFSNLIALCSEDVQKCAKDLLSGFQTEQTYFEGLQDNIQDLVDTKIPLVHLAENDFLYNVREKYSTHVAVYLLLNSGMRAPYLEMCIALKQFENHQNLTTFLTQYGFLIPISFLEQKKGNSSDNSKLEHKIIASSYFYSHCRNFKLDELALKMLQVASFTKKEVTDKVFVFYLLYSDEDSVRSMIEKRGLSKVDKMFYNIIKEKRRLMGSELDKEGTSDVNVDEHVDKISDDDFENIFENDVDEIVDEHLEEVENESDNL